MERKTGNCDDRCQFIQTVITRDSDEHAAALQAWDQTYNQLSPGAFQGALQQIWLDDLHVFRETTNRAVFQSGLPCKASFVFGVPLAMSGTALFGSQIVVPDSLFMFRANDGFNLRTPEFFDVIGIAVPEVTMMAALGGNHEDNLRQLPMGTPLVLKPSASVMAEFQRCLRDLFDPCVVPMVRTTQATERRMLRAALLNNLVGVLDTALPLPPPTPSFPGRCRVVEQAIAFALTSRDDPVTVGDLCEMTRVSRRMLNYCFQDVLHTNPVQYLKAIRLNCVRRELRQLSPGAGVIREVAGRWGFWHFSRFASEYRSLFGELPSDTLHGGRVGPS